jgi:hypothetical protein
MEIAKQVEIIENSVFRRIFGRRRDEVIVQWRELHKEEINNLRNSHNTVRGGKYGSMIWTDNVARMGENRDVHIV